MLILEPVSKRRIWGTERLHDYSGDLTIDKVGSVYTMSAIKEISNPINSEEFQEKDLFLAVKNNPQRFGLKEGESFPIIVSMTGADANLSIQVHPTDNFAKKNENELKGKSESWYFLDAPKSEWIYAGSKLIDKTEIRKKMEAGLFKDVVDTMPIHKGDLVYIPSGTLHALTEGSLVYEIQQSTDITYRFYDFDRVDVDGQKRELHLDKAIDTLIPEQVPSKSVFKKDLELNEQPYKLVRTSLAGEYTNTSPIAQVMTVIEGTLKAEGIKLLTGRSAIIFPNEKISIQECGEVIIATPCLY